jgi:DNA polymerase IV
MGIERPIQSASDIKIEVNEKLFTGQPPIFILPTHMTLDKLHEAEDRLLNHGGNLTYDITEAGIILGKLSHKKRAALELRSRGIWTEEICAISKPMSTSSKAEVGPPLKRQRTTTVNFTVDAATDIVNLSTESEKDKARGQHYQAENDAQTVAVAQLDWLDCSIKTGEPLPYGPFLVYKGRKGIAAPSATPAPPPTIISSQIMKRAREDAAGRPSPVQQHHQFQARRSKEPTNETSSQRNPPVLYRQSTSEHDETVSLPPQPDWVRDQVLYACMRSAPLHPPNEEFISQLVKIRRIRELTLDEIGVRAYSTSIAAIAAYPYVIKRPSEIIALPGCDVKIANLFAEFQQHGACSHTDDDGNVAAASALEGDPVLRVLNVFNEIWGVGAKTARDFYYHRGWRDIDDIVEHGWNSLSRVQQIGVKFNDEFKAGISRSESESIAAIVQRHANQVRPKANGEVQAILVGGYRRGKQICGDVDIILTHRDDTVTRSLIVDLVASLETSRYISHTLSLHLTSTHREQQTIPFRGDETGKHFDTLDKALVVWQDPHFDDQSSAGDQDSSRQKRNPNPHHRVDIIISPWRSIGCAVLGWSGDTTFQRDLRRYAKKAHNWKFDSSGIRERTSGGQVVDLERDGDNWEDREKLVMERMGIGWRPAEERCSR